jgi:hypothetical protein
VQVVESKTQLIRWWNIYYQDNMFRSLHWAIFRSQIVSWFYNTSFFWQLSMVTLSTRSRWMIWAICCIISSETLFETWRWPSARAKTCCLSNKYSTTLLVVFWLYYLHHLIGSVCIKQCTEDRNPYLRVVLNKWF